MKKVISNLVLIFAICVFGYSQRSDSLRWSVGYGTLYGGGLGISYTQPIGKRWNIMAGTSIGLLPSLYHYDVERAPFFNIYKHITDRFVIDTATIAYVTRNRDVVPFSLQISYSPFKNTHLLFGFNTLAKQITLYEPWIISLTQIISPQDGFKGEVVIYKLLSIINLTFKYHYQRFFLALTWSTFILPIGDSNNNISGIPSYPYPQDVYWDDHRRHGLYTFSLTAGYHIFSPWQYIKKMKKNI